MKIPRLFVCAVVIAAVTAALPAQQAPSGFHTVNCLKIKPEKSGEFRKWISDVLQKYARSRVDSGVVSTWYLLRSVMPQGASATCDYLTVAVYPGAPPEPLGPAQMGDALKKAGVSMTGEEYIARRDAIATLVSSQLFRNLDSVGDQGKKGGYLTVSFMKAASVDDWVEFERKVWKPIAEQMVKDGVESGWSLNIQAFGQETDLPYQGITVDVYPSWDTFWKEDTQFLDRAKKVHPETDPTAMFEKMTKVRTEISLQLFAIDDLITAKK